MIYLDTNVILYAIENDPRYGAACARILMAIERKEIAVCASALVLVEVLGALRKLNAILRRRKQPPLVISDNLEAIMALPIEWHDLTPATVERAAQFTLPGQTADHLHLATAELAGAEQILSADADFDSYPSIQRLDPLAYAEDLDADATA